MQRSLKSTCLPKILTGMMLLLGLAGCAVPPSGQALPDPQPAVPATTWLKDAEIAADTVWSGKIVIDGSVKVFKGATLTIAPGTDIAFVRRDADADGLGDGVLIVEGRLVAVGTRHQPIRIRSAAENPAPGDWLEIRVDFSREVHLRYCEIRDSAYTLHAHFTRGVVEDCWIHHNIDGCRLGQANFVFRHNLIEHNSGKGINFRNSRVEAHHNILRHNGSGIFLFESDRDFSIHHNNFHDNLDNLRLGDFYTGDVALADNWWGTADVAAAGETIYDQKKDEAVGRVTIAPATAWITGAGPRDGLELHAAWQYATAGFIDADPVAVDGRLYVASWDGALHVLDPQGQRLWVRPLGDTLDATPALADGKIFLQTWSREVHALDAVTGRTLWRFDYAPSRADDHRQASPLVVDGLVLVPAWNGTLFALDRATGDLRWSFAGGQPLRAAPALDGDMLYLAAGDGTLSALATDGTLRWQHRLAAPLLSTPAVTVDGIVVVSREGRVQALSRDGSPLWQRDLGEPCYYGAPVYQADAVFIATAGGGLWKLNAKTGGVLWRVELAGPSYATPLIADGRVFIGDNSGALQVFGADSGALLARVALGRDVQGRPLLWAGRLLVGSRDHKIHAFDLVDSPAP